VIDLDAVTAIDVHVHAELTRDGHDPMPPELRAAARAYFRSDQQLPTVDDLAAYYRERGMAAVVFTVDWESRSGIPPIPNEEIAEAAAANADLVADQFVTLERDVSDRDQFDRLLRYVWVQHPEGWLMVNGELVAQGLAESIAYEPDTTHHAWLEGLEAEARSAGMGMHGIEPAAGERNLIDDILDFLFGG